MFLTKLSYKNGTDFVDEIMNKKKSISSMLKSIDSLDLKNFTSFQEYSDFLVYAESKLSPKYERDLVDFTFKISEFFQDHYVHQNAYIYLNKSLRLVELYPEMAKNIPLAVLYENLGLTYFYFKRLNIAKEWLYKSLIQKEVKTITKINVYNTIGLIHRQGVELDSSKYYFEKALILAKKSQRRDWVGIISGNLGIYYNKKNDFSKARNLIMQDLVISLETKNWNSAFFAQGLLVKMDLAENKMIDASKGMENATKIIEISPNLNTKSYFYQIQSLYFQKQGKFSEALKSYQLYIACEDTVFKLLNLENFNNIEFQLNYEKKQGEITVLKEKEAKDKFIITALFVFLGTVVIGFIIIFYQVIKRKKREKEILYLQKLRVEEELKNTENQVHEILHNLSEKNQLIEELNTEIETIQIKQQDQKNQIETTKLSERLQTFVLLTEDDWIIFKKLFEKLNPGFFDYFIGNYPDATNAEIRLAALIKLNLSNIEMARTLGISIDSVRKTNLRLRKRLNIEEQGDLLKLIASV
jgi:DNA-binding CsgD family transcriptional regulator